MGDDTAAEGGTKRCPGCGETKPVDLFHRHRRYPDGRQYYCKDCQRLAHRRTALKNAGRGVRGDGEKRCSVCGEMRQRTDFGVDRSRKDGRSYYCKECIAVRKLATARARRAKRIQQLVESPSDTKRCKGCGEVKTVMEFTQNLWVVGGREHRCRDCRRPVIRAASDKWRRENPEEWSLQNREHVRRRKARERSASAAPVDLAKVLEEHGMVCHICGDPITETRGTKPLSLTFDHVVPIARGGMHTEGNLRPAHHSCNSRKNARLMSEVAPERCVR